VSDRKVRITGLVITCIAVASAVITALPAIPARDRTQCCVDSTLLSFELAPSARDAQLVLVSDEAAARDKWSDTDPVRTDVVDKMRQNLRADKYFFAPSYTALFVYFGWLLRRRDNHRILSTIVIVLAFLTFVADQGENISALSLIDDGATGRLIGQIDDAKVAKMRLFSLSKWFLAGLMSLMLGVLFWPRKHWPADVELLSFASAVLLIAGAGFALWGTLATALYGTPDSAIESSFTSTAMAFLPAIVLLSAYRVWLKSPPPPPN
jgi:hypothetical protein